MPKIEGHKGTIFKHFNHSSPRLSFHARLDGDISPSLRERFDEGDRVHVTVHGEGDQMMYVASSASHRDEEVQPIGVEIHGVRRKGQKKLVIQTNHGTLTAGNTPAV